jgi:hypothetical protein
VGERSKRRGSVCERSQGESRSGAVVFALTPELVQQFRQIPDVNGNGFECFLDHFFLWSLLLSSCRQEDLRQLLIYKWYILRSGTFQTYKKGETTRSECRQGCWERIGRKYICISEMKVHPQFYQEKDCCKGRGSSWTILRIEANTARS